MDQTSHPNLDPAAAAVHAAGHCSRQRSQKSGSSDWAWSKLLGLTNDNGNSRWQLMGYSWIWWAYFLGSIAIINIIGSISTSGWSSIHVGEDTPMIWIPIVGWPYPILAPMFWHVLTMAHMENMDKYGTWTVEEYIDDDYIWWVVWNIFYFFPFSWE